MKKAGALFIFLFLFTGSINYSQDSTVTSKLFDMSLKELLNVEVSTSSRSKQMAREASARVSVITARMIKEKGYHDLLDLLRDNSFFQIQSEHGHWTKGAIVNLRGHRSGDAGNNKVLLLIDGVKVSDDAGGGLFMGLNSIPLLSVKQVEIVYGPNSTLYGRDAYAGMINIITSREERAFARFQYGTFNSQKAAGGVIRNFTDDLSGRLVYYSYKSDEQDPTGISESYINRHIFSRHPYTEVFYRGSSHRVIDAGLNYKFLSARYMLFDIEGSETYGSNPDWYVAEYSTQSKQQNHIFSLTGEKKIGDNFEVSGYYNYKLNEFDPSTANLYTGDLNRQGEPGQGGPNHLIDSLYAYGGRKYYYFRTKAHKAGIKAEYAISPNFRNITGIDYNYVSGIPVISEGKGGAPFITDEQKENWEHSFSNTGLYTEFRLHLTENIKFTAGGRYDLNTNYSNTFMPRLALIFHKDEHLLKAIFSKGYLQPSITQVYFESITTFSWIKPNEALYPEKISSYELDWTYTRENLQFGVNLFYNDLQDAIMESVHIGDSAYVNINGESIYVPVLQSMNVSSGRRWGGNLGIRGKIGEGLQADINYSFLDGYDEISGTRTDVEDNLVSNHKITGGILWNPGKISVYSGFIWFSKRRIESNHKETEYAGLLDSEGYLNFGEVFLWNLNIRVNEIFPGINGWLRVNNLLDREYYGQTINATWGTPKILQDMRRIDVGVEYTY